MAAKSTSKSKTKKKGAAAETADAKVPDEKMPEAAAPHGGRGGPPGAGAVAEAAAEPVLIGHSFKLYAYSLKNGAALLGDGYELPLVNEDSKATEPPDTKNVRETLSAGPISLVKEGVKCRGTTLIFAGNDVKSVDTQGKQFTPPPGFFAREPRVREFRG